MLYFCLCVNHVNKPIIFVFGAFVYYFKNAISICVTIYRYPQVHEDEIKKQIKDMLVQKIIKEVTNPTIVHCGLLKKIRQLW